MSPLSVARIECSEIRDHPVNAATPPGFRWRSTRATHFWRPVYLKRLGAAASQRLVPALIVEIGPPGAPALRRGGAEFEREAGSLVGVEGFRVGPCAHHFIVIDARRRLPVDLVAHRARLLLAGLGQRLDERRGGGSDGGIAAEEIYVLHHVDRAAGWRRPRRRIGERLQHVAIRRAVADRLQRA